MVRIGPYQWPELLFLALVNVAPLPIAFWISRTGTGFVVRWLLMMMIGAVLWLTIIAIVGRIQFRK